MNKFDALFKAQDERDWLQGEIEKIAIMTGRDTPTGLAAFGYPCSTSSDWTPGFEAIRKCHFFYSTMIVIELEDIPSLIQELKQRGFELTRLYGDEGDTRSLTFTSEAGRLNAHGLYDKYTGQRIA